jgi:hypothetical protein
MLPLLEDSSAGDSGALSFTDGWLLRVFICLYALYCLVTVFFGLKARHKGSWVGLFRQMMSAYLSFTFLVMAAGIVVIIWMVRPLFTDQYMNSNNPKDIWYLVVGIGHVSYGISQGRISVQRVPQMLLNKRQKAFIAAVPYILYITLFARLTMNSILVGLRARNEDPYWVRLLTLVVGVVSCFVFSMTEACISVVSRALMKSSLDSNNHKLYHVSRLLSRGNMLACIASTLDIINHFVVSEVIEALVIVLGTSVFVTYSRLMRPDDGPSIPATKEYSTFASKDHLPGRPLAKSRNMGASRSQVDLPRDKPVLQKSSLALSVNKSALDRDEV